MVAESYRRFESFLFLLFFFLACSFNPAQAIEYILPDQQALFVKELEPHVLKCVKDANGNHVRLGFIFALDASFIALLGHSKTDRARVPRSFGLCTSIPRQCI